MISIITPVLNGEQYIEACIRNVLEQKYVDLEHIIVNGNSTDRTGERIELYAGKFSHIRLLSEHDKGQSHAMNKGIAMARGNVLGILNIDDYYQPGTLPRIMEIFRSIKEPGMIVGNCNVWDDQGNLLYINRPRKLRIEDLVLGWAINPHPVNPSAYFYHRSLHDRIGEYDENEHYALDLDFLLKAAKVAHVRYVDEIFGNFRMVAGTKTVVDQARGTAKMRTHQLLERHRKMLPLRAQCRVWAKTRLHNTKRIIYRALK